MNNIDLIKASEVMRRAADGELVEAFLKSDFQRSKWFYHQGPPQWCWNVYDYRILDFPPPPEGTIWHNPAGLNATQVGVHEGWRLLLESEIDDKDTSGDQQWWMTFRGPRWEPSLARRTVMDTIRTKSPLPSSVPMLDDKPLGLESFLAMSQLWVKFCNTPIGKSSTPETLNGFCSGWEYAKEYFTRQNP